MIKFFVVLILLFTYSLFFGLIRAAGKQTPSQDNNDLPEEIEDNSDKLYILIKELSVHY